MKVLGISGSPRKGNTEFMVSAILERLESKGIETELILLRKKDVRNCKGCLTCEAGGSERKGICALKDDMNGILPLIVQADALVMGTPVYFEMVSGLLKNFMDRTCPIWTKLQSKKMIGTAVAEEGIGKAVDNLKTYASLCGMDWIGSVTALAKMPDDAGRNAGVKRRLLKLADKLAEALV
jgi:multimeric flavodoxin WrbA